MRELLEAIAAGEVAPAPALTEAEYHDLWLARVAGETPQTPDGPDLVTMAALGGALADRLPWVFVAGYQAALRRAFPEVCGLRGWTCYAASEDRDGKIPGVTLDEEHSTISGTKTWVATSDHVASLVVSVRHEGQRLFLVDRDAPGVEVTTPRRAGFLGDMSQGRVTFTDTPATHRLDVEGARIFGIAEPLHVLSALNGYMLAHTTAHAAEHDTGHDLIEAVTTALLAASRLAESELDAPTVTVGLAELDAQTQAAAEAFEPLVADADPAFFARWNADRRLITMFSAGIQRRLSALGPYS